MHPLDHILWAAPDLDPAAQAFAEATGVTPAGGGSHPGFGTRNRLAGLGGDHYFEVISVDPAQRDLGDRARRIAALARPELHTFAVRGTDVAGFRDLARGLGLATAEPVAMSRMRGDGVLLRWRVVTVADPHWGDMLPFLIDWMDSEHPSATAPADCTLREFCALHPEAEALATIYDALGVTVPVRRAPRPGFLLRLESPRGEVILT
ncbi:MAG: hypothetical protein CVT84_03985 [Alphaproteobacteria bacterium HGW-Alphaproteobacteria-6]|nr:MAG: hypothetical protein CVT84_03985 [Alphaproteobacteria bacterium HGW-Alphaproteobacteria-6]